MSTKNLNLTLFMMESNINKIECFLKQNDTKTNLVNNHNGQQYGKKAMLLNVLKKIT